MSSLHDIVHRVHPPTPWAEGDNIPWEDPAFSERMLAEHLSQEHDLATRRAAAIESHLATITSLLPDGGRVLDLGCGPGMYAHALAQRGYQCHGIDFAPASIEHARAVAAVEGLGCTFQQADLRSVDFEADQDMVMLIYGQINVFPRPVARDVVARACDALRPGGVLVLEPQTEAVVRDTVATRPTWSTSEGGLFSERPHLVLEESWWDEAERTAIQRWYVIDAETGEVDRISMSTCGYGDGELEAVLAELGFVDVETGESLAADPSLATEGLRMVVARRPETG